MILKILLYHRNGLQCVSLSNLSIICRWQLVLSLRPEMADSLVCPSMLLLRVHSHNFSATTTMSFSTRRANEWAGLALYRTAKGYYSLLKGKNEIRLTIDK